jgi:Arc/MetJ family transcription regulator
VAKTLVDIDDALLTEAASILGTRTKKDTVNAALREVLSLDARRRDLEWLVAGGAAELADPAQREAAWR